ncbi:YlcI/YnfO family protein [Salinimonas lutimaris]|uniref:YlcI/YnfO family protein n=1 Tax=Salinimonas lutimaris TaxID=914153 RepID=UPI0010C023C4|nr:YlcI/YnfO family protein [Salinimonas lutimaris]
MQEKNKGLAKRPDERKGSTRKNIRFEDALVEQIESNRAKSGEAFSEWVKDACRKKLSS